MSLFNTDFGNQVLNWLPPVVRGASHVQWLYSLIWPVQTKIDSDTPFTETTLDDIRYNGQKMVMQGGINEKFGIVAVPFILIETRQTFNGLPALVLDEIEVGETSIVADQTEGVTMLIIDDTEETAFVEDFKVKIPLFYHSATFEAQVDEEVKKYKVAGTTYTIETY